MIEKFRQRRYEIDALLRLGKRADAQEFQVWCQRTTNLLSHVFGERSRQVADFCSIRFVPLVDRSWLTGEHPDFHSAFLSGCNSAKAALDVIIADAEEFGLPMIELPQQPPLPTDRVVRILDRFHRVALSLARRQRDREPFKINDEYDVQDLLRALLLLDFDDVRPEEPTPSGAGGGSKVDLLLKDERIMIEVKMVRPRLTDAKLREELGADVTYYAAHPDCGTLFCFVYDPGHLLKQPAAFERDLSTPRNEMPVTVMVRPKA